MLTIHMTTHRRFESGLLSRAVNSVLAQDFRDFELVICDDASTDGTADYLLSLRERDSRVKILRNDRNVNSVAISLGRCLLAADPARQWISWMFDDCRLLPNALSLLMQACKHETIEMLYGVTEVLLEDGNVLRVGDCGPLEVRDAIDGSSILVPNGGLVVKRSVIDKVGWYDPNIILRRSCDWDLFRRIVQAGVPFATIKDVLMREYGELQPDSLRKSFTTDFTLMRKYAQMRDAAGLRLDVRNILAMPMDWIPAGDWTSQDLGLIKYMFLEYFLSIGDIPRAFHWAKHLGATSVPSTLMHDNLLRAAAHSRREIQWMAAGAYAGAIFGAYRSERDL